MLRLTWWTHPVYTYSDYPNSLLSPGWVVNGMFTKYLKSVHALNVLCERQRELQFMITRLINLHTLAEPHKLLHSNSYTCIVNSMLVHFSILIFFTLPLLLHTGIQVKNNKYYLKIVIILNDKNERLLHYLFKKWNICCIE